MQGFCYIGPRGGGGGGEGGDLPLAFKVCILHIHICTAAAHIHSSVNVLTNFHSRFCNIEKHTLVLVLL